MEAEEADRLLRLSVFNFLAEQTDIYGEALPRSVLAAGLAFEGRRVPVVGPQGIFKPAAVRTGIPLSITTVPVVEGRARPYEDEVSTDGLVLYRYRGTDPQHHENVGLRRAMVDQVPLVYLAGLTPGWYLPQWPAFVVADDPGSLTFTIAIDEPQALRPDLSPTVVDEARRAYVTRLARHRLHQVAFRQRVITAYRSTCAICRLRHVELLDAAHILPDGHPRGDPVVPNGLALCKIHHAAFDRNIVGVRPDLVVEVRAYVLTEVDGPMLRHGLQETHGVALVVPRRRELRPSTDRLEERYAAFRRVG